MAKILSDVEMLAVLTILQLKELPEELNGFTFMELFAQPSVMDKRQEIIDLYDDLSEMIAAETERADDIQATADAVSADLMEFKQAAETLVYKIKDEPACKVKDWFEFKELKARLGIF
jgi:chromatin segregation and condensation protein Rec8/ScpA/Scc1 (kleisin family)